MNELREEDRTPAERSAQEALGALPSPRPDAEFRARVARGFVSGSLRSSVRHRPLIARIELWAMVGAAAAVVVVAAALNRGPDWRVIEVRGTGTVSVDGRPLPLEGGELGRAIRRGAHLTLPGTASLDLVAPGMVAVSVEGGSDLVLPGAPNRWWSRAARGHVTVGNVFISTGRAFHGATLEMETPEAVAHVTGTSLAVLRDLEAGTCVCVMEGRVVVSYEEGKESVPVPAGKRCVCPLEGEAEVGPILHYSEHALHRLNEKSAAVLGR
jgi:ferric-dicitrate binding protein FerR (iron transport regulator)